MGKARPLCTPHGCKSAQLLASEVAGEQWGVIGAGQLRNCGVTKRTTDSWLARGRLYIHHPGVYTLGHRSIPIEGQLVAALLYAGPDAVLSHATAAWWWGLISAQPPVIELSAPRRVIRSNGVAVHRRTHLDATRHRRFPITSIAQTLVDYAATADLLDVRRALAQADYLRMLDSAAVRAATGQGRKGTAAVRKALGHHQPMLARTRSWLEVVFVPLCEAASIPMPELNARVAGWTVDAFWRMERVVVELDGYDNHSTRAQMERDRRKELDLRLAGFLVIRYTRAQVVDQPDLVAADLLARLAERRLDPWTAGAP